MSSLTVHNLDDETHDGLRDLADSHGRTIEDEAREILHQAVTSQRAAGSGNGAGLLGSRIAARFAAVGLEGDIPELRGHVAVPPTLTE